MRVSAGRNGCYSIVYIVCEALNFVNVIGQMFLLDRFFGGAFIEYGLKVSVALERVFKFDAKKVMNIVVVRLGVAIIQL